MTARGSGSVYASRRWRWLAATLIAAVGLSALAASQLRGPSQAYFLMNAVAVRQYPALDHRDFWPPAPFRVPTGEPGNPNISAVNAGTDDLDAKQARALVLVDTSPGRNFSDGIARLGSDPRNPQTYSVGAILLNGARLSEICADYVVLERNGESVRLYVRGKQASAGQKSSPLLLVGGPGVALPAAALTNDAMPRSEQGIIDFIRPNPVFENEQLLGLVLYPGVHPSAFAQLGLVSGDLLTALNNAPVADVDQVLEMFEQVMTGAVVDATIRRAGRTEHVKLDGSTVIAGKESE